MRWRASALTVILAAAASGQAYAQRADDNAVRAAQDAFGVSVGNERIGVYHDRDVRGFSPVSASNVRVEGLYFDMRGNLPVRLLAASQIKVGLTAQGYPFPAPTGIVDYQFKQIGAKPIYTALAQLGPNAGYSYELEAYVPAFDNKLGLFAGGNLRSEELVPGQLAQPASLAGVARWRPNADISAMAFYGHFDRYGAQAIASVFTSGPFLPPDIEARRLSQDWTESESTGDTYGATIKGVLTENWTLNAGVFRYFQLSSGVTSETFLGVDESGMAASHRFRRDPAENKMDSYSGEARLTGIFTGERLRHTLHFSFRTREAMRTFGGSSSVTLGPVQIDAAPKIAEPVFTFGTQSRDETSQSNFGAGYALAWRGVGEFSAGVQKAAYNKTVLPPAGAEIVTESAPVLHNLALALTPTDKLVLYASYTRGLEDAVNAPDIAVNASEAPPAMRTVQRDFGMRYALTPRMRLIAGWFDIEKPYFNLDTTNVYRQLGTERHSGYELSLSGQVNDRLNLVVGAVLMKPEVTGEAVLSGQIGARPVGQPETVIRINADYRLQSVPGLSVDAALNHTSEKAASSRQFAELGGDQLSAESYTTLDLGLRYRFKIFGGNAATVRAQITNATDAFAWQTSTSGAFTVSTPRGALVSLAVDF